MMTCKEIRGREYGQLNGWRYGYWHARLAERGDGLVEIQLVTWARLIAISQVSGGAWLIPTECLKPFLTENVDCPEVIAAIDVIMEEWDPQEILDVGPKELNALNNLGLKAQDTVEKN